MKYNTFKTVFHANLLACALLAGTASSEILGGGIVEADSPTTIIPALSLLPESPVVPGSSEGQSGRLPVIYYTYQFTNTARVPIQVAFVDNLPNELVWDTSFLPVIRHPIGAILGDGIDLDELLASVVYTVGGKEARVDSMRLPPGRSEMTLRTAPTSFVGTVANDATIVFGSGASITIAATATIKLGSTVPFPTAFANSGVADFSVLVLGGSLKLAGDKTTITGEVGVGPGVSQNLQTGIITGNYYVHPPATGSVGGVVTGSAQSAPPVAPIMKDLTALKTEALQLAEQAAGLEPTLVLDTIDTAKTLTSVGGVNVVFIRSIKLGGRDELTLSGAAGDYFILNVHSGAQFTSAARIVLAGGIGPEHVLINLMPGASELSTTGQAEILGAVLAVNPGNAVKIAGNSAISASFAAYDFDMTGNSDIMPGLHPYDFK